MVRVVSWTYIYIGHLAYYYIMDYTVVWVEKGPASTRFAVTALEADWHGMDGKSARALSGHTSHSIKTLPDITCTFTSVDWHDVYKPHSTVHAAMAFLS